MASARFLDPSSIPLKRQSGGNIWATLVPIIQGAIVVGLLAVVGLFFLPVIQTENGYKGELAKLQRETAAAEDQQAELKLETEHMKNDPAYVEHIARDQLQHGQNPARPSSPLRPRYQSVAPSQPHRLRGPVSADDSSK